MTSRNERARYADLNIKKKHHQNKQENKKVPVFILTSTWMVLKYKNDSVAAYFLYLPKPLDDHLLGFQYLTQMLEGSHKDTELFIVG